jgi:ribosomal protein L18E
MKVTPEIVTFIRDMREREKHPRIGKEKINLLKIVQVTKD